MLERLSKLYPLTPAFDGEAWMMHESVTPTFRFRYHVRPGGSRDALVQVAVRDGYEAELAAGICRAIDEAEESVFSATVARKLQPVSIGASGFDALVVLPPGYHNSYAAQDAELAGRTFVVFPAYDCEFCATESRDAMVVLRRGVVDTVDWGRKPSPRVSMRYSNPKTRGGSAGSKRGITNVSVVRRELLNLTGAAGAFIEIENFKHEVLRVTTDGVDAKVDGGREGYPESLKLEDLPGMVGSFLGGEVAGER